MPAKAGIQYMQAFERKRCAGDYWIVRFRGR
jgi:hypothetical protein